MGPRSLPYLVDVRWTERRAACCSRCSPATSAASQVLAADPTTGATTVAVAGRRRRVGRARRPASPAVLADGRLVMAADRDGARRLLVDGEPVTPPELQVRGS